MNDSTWTWISGSKTVDFKGSYGDKGQASDTNAPGARLGAAVWYDSSTQEFWVFGGHENSGVILNSFNDLWRYRMNDSTWTWMSGSDTTDEPGVYGEKGVANSTNVPGARWGAVGWYDRSRQEFWLFGGHGFGYDNSIDGA